MFTLIDLPYEIDALEPVISARTLEFHHGKHLQGYVDNLNKLIVGTEFEALCHSEPSCHSERSEESVVCHSERSEESGICHSERSEESILSEIVAKAPAGPIFNNAGQILNHNLYFTQFRSFVADAPQDDTRCHSERCCHSERSEESGICHSERSEESGFCHSERSEESLLLNQIATQWGTLVAFQKEFETKGATLFGSGWVWLQADAKGELSIAQYAGADNPVAHDLKPILTFDVWEHAYYLDYQNRRPAHLAALWDIVDWKVLEMRYKGK